ncbi:MAG: nuclear transport factor 2 family protein [Marmoricola sp.]
MEGLRRAVGDHDIDAVVACFAEDYRNETPVHPGRGFEGRDQVRVNWQRILGGLPDVAARVLRVVEDGAVVWSEWEIGGHRPDGRAELLRGVIVFGVEDDLLAWSRFYLEPVDDGTDDVDAAVGRLVGADSP